MKVERKYYVAHPRMKDPANSWAHATEADAIEHAEDLLRADPHSEFQFVVKIIKVVRRKEPPVVVESVT